SEQEGCRPWHPPDFAGSMPVTDFEEAAAGHHVAPGWVPSSTPSVRPKARSGAVRRGQGIFQKARSSLPRLYVDSTKTSPPVIAAAGASMQTVNWSLPPGSTVVTS